ncbi:MAG TPA: hypothetical protein VHC42_05275 [Rhizomicrobium sp.]|nr:hypothetical protein [Rhizomicrobium sp.]
MNKLATIGLAAFVAAAAAGRADAKSFNVSLDGLCDTIAFKADRATGTYGVMHQAGCPLGALRAPSSNPIPGVGIVVKHNGPVKKRVMFGETQPDGGGNPVGYAYALDYPPFSGGTWSLYVTKDGVTVTEAATGTYTLN